MRAPQLTGRIERRILVDHLVSPELAQGLVPDGVDLRLVDGRAVVGMCLIHLSGLRPRHLPLWTGTSVEAVAHRISVWGPADQGRVGGVFVPRRDTTSRAAAAVGGRLFPGVHGLALIDVHEDGDRFAISATTADGATIDVAVHRPPAPGVCVAEPLTAAPARTPQAAVDGPEPDQAAAARADALSALHRSELLAWSPDPSGRGLEVVEMRCHRWSTSSLVVERASSSWLRGLPGMGGGALASPSALLMEELDVSWAAPR